jgi:hypothetical protein
MRPPMSAAVVRSGSSLANWIERRELRPVGGHSTDGSAYAENHAEPACRRQCLVRQACAERLHRNPAANDATRDALSRRCLPPDVGGRAVRQDAGTVRLDLEFQPSRAGPARKGDRVQLPRTAPEKATSAHWWP